MQKGGVIYGPMTREALDSLLVKGKIARSDLVSVRGGEWLEITTFLLQPSSDKGDATLRLLAGERVYSSLSRREVEQLRSEGRADDDDLICALNGPWMRVGDFFARTSAPPCVSRTTAPDAPQLDGLPDESSPPAQPPAAAPAVPIPALPPSPAASASAPGSARAVVAAAPPAAASAPSHSASTDSYAAIGPLPVLIGPGVGYHSPPPVLPPGVCLSDVWFVRVRGMHSAPLKKRHVRRLFEARELTADSPARNANWPDEAWSPIYLIPELADIAK